MENMENTIRSFTDELGEWVSLAEAARMLPSPRAGKKTHLSTIYRLAAKHKLPLMRRGRWLFLRKADLGRLFTREPIVETKAVKPSKQTERWAQGVLKKAGIINV